MSGPSDAKYWEARYVEGTAQWDLGAPTPAWERLVPLEGIAPGRALVLGSGPGHDALWFAARAFDVVAVDFAPTAIAATNAAAAKAGLRVDAREADLFALTPETVGTFDLVVEHTCFCAIEPARRGEYAEVVARLTRPGGRFIGVFFWETPPDGPPFATSPGELETLFSPAFRVDRLEPNPASVPRRAGREGWAVLVRR